MDQLFTKPQPPLPFQKPSTVTLSVIAPTYNESENIEALIEALSASLQGIDYEILISDDNSPDHTWALAEQLSKHDKRIRVLRRNGNRGVGPAVVDGFSYAQGEIVACIDADLQHDPCILPKMLKGLEAGSEIVVGSRYVDGGGTLNWNWRRRFTSWAATKMAEWLVGLKVRDPMSGYFMLRREDFLRVRPLLRADGFKILLEIAARLRPERVCEVPYTFRTRQAGKSKLSSKVILAYLVQLWRLGIVERLQPTDLSLPPSQQPAHQAEDRRHAA